MRFSKYLKWHDFVAVFDNGNPDMSKVYGISIDFTKMHHEGMKRKRTIRIYWHTKIIEIGYIVRIGHYGQTKR